ncbi:hypothetical protein DERF_012719 [Dermatophagoides farinae]|uniref:Uncharacterized protein n=1 Tax=Dermatophagoides farinae TaxID=6954 RepID=A0A922HQK9_DERFA|nr:hypothetical protein DERF_012719 [Dermatophagoides farinae]
MIFVSSSGLVSNASGLDFRLMTFFFEGFFGLPSSGFSSGISSSGFCSSSGSSMISSVTVTVVSSVISFSSASCNSAVGAFGFVNFLTNFFLVSTPTSDSMSVSASSSGSSMISSVTVTVVSSVISFSSASCNSAVGSFGFVNFLTNFFFVSTPTSDSMSGCISSSGACSSRISSVGFKAITSSVVTFVSSSGLASKASCLDFRLMTFFFEGFFGLPSSGFSSGISSSGFCFSSGNSMISSVTVTIVSSVISFSSASCKSAVGSFGFVNFLTNFFLVSTPTSDSISGCISSSGACSSRISSVGFKAINSSVMIFVSSSVGLVSNASDSISG